MTTEKTFYMVNYLDLNENPPILPATGQGASAWDLLGHYNEFMFPNLFSRACHPVFGGPVVSDALDLLNIEEGKLGITLSLCATEAEET